MRSEVLRDPPPKRLRTVVLREGPPKGRRPGIDLAVGVAGMLLLALAGSLVAILPEEDVLLPQFEVTPTQTRINETFDGGLVVTLRETETVIIPVEIPYDNVNNIIVDLYIQEDLATSLPDRFEVTVYDPLGRQQEDTDRIETPPPTLDDAGLNFQAGEANARLNYGIGTPPEGGFVTGARENVTAEQVREAYLEPYLIPSTGIWEIHIRLVEAGDCPGPADLTDKPGGEAAQRVAECRRVQNDGQDTGNDVTLELLQYTYFDVQVSEL